MASVMFVSNAGEYDIRREKSPITNIITARLIIKEVLDPINIDPLFCFCFYF